MTMAIALPAALILFALSGVYRSIFRFAGLGMLRSLARIFLIFGFVMAVTLTVGGISGIPRTVGFILPIILFMLMAGSRIMIRYVIVELLGRHQFEGSRKTVLIYGAGSAGQQVASSLRAEPELDIVGFIDDDKGLRGKQLDGKPVYWSKNIGAVITDKHVTDILLALPSASRRQRREIVNSLREFRVSVQTLPHLRDLAGGRVTVNDMRPLAIEDLLGREPVAPDEALLGKTVVGKNVLVSGAGGSIGSELCRQIASIGAARLVLFEMNEFSIYQIERELRDFCATGVNSGMEIIPVLGSIRDGKRISDLYARYEIDTVYHAAAYKHVPLVEANPIEAIKNNIVGTHELVRAAANGNIADFILISTDKAVRPTNVMGATKRAAEQILQSYADTSKSTRFSMVRFGNVLGSSGSVVPLFRKQIEEGGPITLTHKKITRYFMTIPEAATLVIQAAGMAKGGEVFVLDMGKPITIEQMARTMVQLSGLTIQDEANPDGDIEIVEVGLRPGEKLYEELLIGDSPQNTQHPRIMMAHEGFADHKSMQTWLQELSVNDDVAEAIKILKKFVPEFNHQPNGTPTNTESKIADTPAAS